MLLGVDGLNTLEIDRLLLRYWLLLWCWLLLRCRLGHCRLLAFCVRHLDVWEGLMR